MCTGSCTERRKLSPTQCRDVAASLLLRADAASYVSTLRMHTLPARLSPAFLHRFHIFKWTAELEYESAQQEYSGHPANIEGEIV